jgi:CRISPR system Cascade subunit CasE
MMFMSRLRLTGPEAKRVLTGGEYRHHQALWALFSDSPERRRDFIYRRMDGEPGLAFLVVSERPPSNPLGNWSVETKEYAPALSVGDRLGFSLRANPVRAGRNAGGKQARFDVVMDRKKALREQGLGSDEMPSQAAIAQEAGTEWIKARQEKLGFEADLEGLRADGYRILEMPRGKGKGKVRIATLDFEGVCCVEDPGRMQMALFNGIGPAKAFGCGLMLVKRA